MQRMSSFATRGTELPLALVDTVDDFKTEMLRAERGVKDRTLDDEQVQAGVSAACGALVATLRDAVRREPHRQERIGAYALRETYAVLTRSANIDRWFAKPRGYAGDYYTIELMYRAQPEGDGRLGRFVDRWALDIPAVCAVRNRRRLLARAIRDVTDAAAGGPARITSLASGPAREIFDVLTAADAPAIQATCIDIDAEAIAYGADRARSLGVADRVVFAQDNVLRLSRGRGRTALPPQHLIYSVGLIDYLADEHVVRLLDWMHEQLLPGGTAILGNFDVGNPDRAFMDHLPDWRLIHRTADDLRALFARSRFGDSPVDVRAEEERVNLFAFCARRGATRRGPPA
jgi:extracellular factor (EF) 3-hydroxypalmitic acid methyl ester biosynthesis protein